MDKENNIKSKITFEFDNLYPEIVFIIPQILQDKYNIPTITINETENLNICIQPKYTIEDKKSKYKICRRGSPSPPETNTIYNCSLEISSEIDHIIKSWYDLQYNSQDGTMNYKRDVIGYIIINWYNAIGEVIRRIVFNNVQLTNIEESDKVLIKFECDSYTNVNIYE